jgi:hypothetical protein
MKDCTSGAESAFLQKQKDWSGAIIFIAESIRLTSRDLLFGQ